MDLLNENSFSLQILCNRDKADPIDPPASPGFEDIYMFLNLV